MGAASALPRSRYQQKASPQPEALYFAGQMPVISLRRIEISRIALGVDRSLFLCRGFTGGRVGKSRPFYEAVPGLPLITSSRTTSFRLLQSACVSRYESEMLSRKSHQGPKPPFFEWTSPCTHYQKIMVRSFVMRIIFPIFPPG